MIVLDLKMTEAVIEEVIVADIEVVILIQKMTEVVMEE